MHNEPLLPKGYRVKLLDLKKIKESEVQSYLPLTDPPFHSVLHNVEPYEIEDSPVLAIALMHHGEPAGLLTGSYHPEMDYLEVHSLYVLPEHRNTSLYAALLRRLNEEAVRLETYLLTAQIPDDEPYSPLIEKAFRVSGWEGPKLFMTKYFYDCYSFNPPWFNRPPKLAKGFRTFKWKNLKPKEREEIEYRTDESLIPDTVYPFDTDEAIIEPINSIGLRHNGKLIGWCLTHRVAHDTIRYTALYIDPAYEASGYAIRLLVDSIALQQKSPVKWSLFDINEGDADRRWGKFVRHRLAPYAQAISRINQYWKVF